MGRQKHFVDAQELVDYFEMYLESCKENNKIPNLAGFARYCYCDKSTLLNYNVETHPFFGGMKMIYTFLEDETIDNKMSDNFKKFYMVNTFKEYKDKTDSNVVVSTDSKLEDLIK